MKVMKKAFALILTLVMACTMYIPVSAAGNHTLTINSETDGHTYQAYQVFAGDYYEGVLSNVIWGTGVNGENLLAALKTDDTVGTYFTDAEDAEDVAEVLSADNSAFTDNSTLLDAFADVVSEHVTGDPATSGTPSGNAEDGYVYTIGNLADGYYFITEDEMTDADNNAYTKFMLQVMGDTTVNAKADVPSIDKKIDGANDTDPGTTGDTEANNAAIGDSVPFKVTSKVPDMNGYNNYFFVVTDTLSAGLSFNNDVVITLGGEQLTPDEDYTVSQAGQTVTITFIDFIQYAGNTGADILIRYSATLNEDAVIGTAGNPNAVDLTYSNNPNVDTEGDTPGQDDPTGTTPDEITYTYVTGVELTKVNTENERLTGAEFQISGTRLNTVLVYRDVFTEAADGTYWKLNDGTYTTEAPTPDTEHGYASTTTKYALSQEEETITKGEDVTYTGTVGSDGVLRFDGLAAGDYVITELVAPNGYNLLDGPVNITIGWSAPSVPGGACSWTVSGVDGATVENGIIKLTIENTMGSTLPETGGIGTAIFYIIGVCLMLGAGILLVVKTRMSGKDK